MDIFEYYTEQWLPTDIHSAWDFFSSPKNLATITPRELDFVILTTSIDREIYTGMKIHYRVRPLFGVPVRWETEITDVSKPYTFIDKQVKGPYAMWEHRHEFIEKKNGVVVVDHVRYALPLGIIGRIAHFLIVKKKIESIFTYRRQVLTKIFDANESNLQEV